LRPGEVAMPLAGLDRAIPREDPQRFFTDLVSLLLAPTLTLLHLGVALEAHGQNTLLVLDRGRPVRLLYRDVGGVRVSRRRLAGHGVQCPPLHGDIPNDDPDVLRTKLFASLVSTVVGGLVAALVREHGLARQWLWDAVARAARAVYAQLPTDAGADAAALFGDS